ncbi:MAG: hypothetical protein LBH65_01625 [Desulfovibrio sp.]|jgi:hypothetical protein|nr:hypothetical protein [Desulfovibrio sp.]
MTPEFANALSRISSVVMFENWLRFYFIAEEGDSLYLRLPEKAMDQIRNRYADFHELAEHLNNREITHDASLKEVCLFVAGSFNDKPLPEQLIARVFDSPEFHLEMQFFSYWVQAHEEQLDAAFMEFSEWRKSFSAWKETDAVRDYADNLAADQALAEAEAPETTQ